MSALKAVGYKNLYTRSASAKVCHVNVLVMYHDKVSNGDSFFLAVYRAASNTSELLILNAQDIAGEPAAVPKLPRRVPGGFHGT